MTLGNEEKKEVLSSYGQYAVQAYFVWRGPKNIIIREADGRAEKFYGWPVLALEAQESFYQIVESRIIYQNIFDEDQKNGILRVVSWDGKRVNRELREGKTPEFQVSARFVEVPSEQILNWLSVFESVPIGLARRSNSKHKLLRRLRIEWDYKADVFERVWISSANSNTLTRKWNDVWQQMTTFLDNAPPLQADIDEDFWTLEWPISYIENNHFHQFDKMLEALES